MLKKILFIIIILSTNIVKSQDSISLKISELEKELNIKKDIEKINVLDRLAKLYLEKNVDKAIDYADEGLDLVDDLEIEKYSKSFYNVKGEAFFKKKKYRKSTRFYRKELGVLRKYEKNKENVMRAFFNIATVYKIWGKEKKAIKNYEEALNIAKKQNKKKIVARTSLILHKMYKEIGDYKKSLSYFKTYNNFVTTEDKKKQEEEISLLKNEYKEVKQKVEDKIKEVNLKDSIIEKAEVKEKQLVEDTVQKAKAIDSLGYEKARLFYKNEMTNIELKLNEQKVKEQQNLIVFFIIISLIILTSSIWLFSLYRQKRKANRLLEAQKIEISTQSEELQATNEELYVKNKQVIDSINYAKRIQDAILLSEKEIKLKLPETFIFFSPKDIVSGDFYWFTQEENKIIISAIDCTGHGVPGAFMSMIGNTLLNAIVNEQKITDPGEILTELHLGVQNALRQTEKDSNSEDGMDMSLCCFDFEEKSISFAGARNHLFVVTNEEVKLLKADKYGIGGNATQRRRKKPTPPPKFTTQKIDIKTEPLGIYMCSDGYMDQFGGENKRKFGRNQFKELLKSVFDLPANEQKQILEQTFREWQQNSKQIDDVLVIGIKINNQKDNHSKTLRITSI